MHVSRWLLVVLLLTVLVASLVAVVGCPQKPVETPPIVTPPAETQPTGAAGATPAFKWTEKPVLADIPAGAIKGMINGKPFTAKTVRVRQGQGNAVLSLSNKEIGSPTDVITGDTGVDLTFSLPEGKLGEMVLDMAAKKNFGKEHAYYHYPQGEDQSLMSVNPDWACALQVTWWKLEKDSSDAAILGEIKGKVAITFKDDAKSWVAGTFETVYYK